MFEDFQSQTFGHLAEFFLFVDNKQKKKWDKAILERTFLLFIS